MSWTDSPSCVGLARRRASAPSPPQWFNALAGIAAIGSLVGGAALRVRGFISPGGAYGPIATLVFPGWTVVASGILTMQAKAEEAARPATADAIPGAYARAQLPRAWRWLILVYAWLEEEDRVVVVTIQDGRAATSLTTRR